MRTQTRETRYVNLYKNGKAEHFETHKEAFDAAEINTVLGGDSPLSVAVRVQFWVDVKPANKGPKDA